MFFNKKKQEEKEHIEAIHDRIDIAVKHILKLQSDVEELFRKNTYMLAQVQKLQKGLPKYGYRTDGVTPKAKPGRKKGTKNASTN